MLYLTFEFYWRPERVRVLRWTTGDRDQFVPERRRVIQRELNRRLEVIHSAKTSRARPRFRRQTPYSL
jgi:hypothetical protein